MKILLSLASPAALLLLLAPLLFAQSTSSASEPVTQPVTQSAPAEVPQPPSVILPDEEITYFSLEHRTPDQIEASDAELLKKRHRDVLAEAEFYGYDMSSGSWNYEQSVCPLMPDYVMLRYSSKNGGDADSIFMILVPRTGGRILTVPVLNKGATRFRPAPVDPRNFQIFTQVIPADIAKLNSGSEGKWLTLSVCYAEMTGARPQVPNKPQLDLRMIKAPQPTLRIFIDGKAHEVRFVDPVSQTDYRLWDIVYNEAGRVTSVNDDQHAFGEVVISHPTEPVPKQMPAPPATTPKYTNPPLPQPQ
jgi:hypothetical protein